MASRDMIGSKVDGLEESRRALEKIIRAEMAAIPGALELIGQQLTTEVKRRAPVATGTLRRSYNWETGQDGRDAWVEVGSNVAYAAYQEFGTSRQEGTPHLRPAVDALRPQIRALLAEHVGRGGAGAFRGIGGGLAGVARTLAGLARGGATL